MCLSTRRKKEGFLGKNYNGKAVSPDAFKNHVAAEFELWMDVEAAKFATKGCLTKWSEIAERSQDNPAHDYYYHWR